MAWSLFKILLFVTAVAVVAVIASTVVDSVSTVRLEIGNFEISTSALILTTFVILLLPAIWLVFFLFGLARATVGFLLGDETALSRYFNKNREQRGFEALADGLLALASGEPKLAMMKAARAENLLRRPEITGIITAQAAERAGEPAKAVAAYKRLLNDDRTRFAGIAGLLKHKLEAGDTELALRLAEKAFVIKPQHDDMQNTLLRLQSGVEDWEGARQTLAAKLKHRKIPRDVFRRRNAVLSFAAARKKLPDGGSAEDEQQALAANRESPGLIPAAVFAAGIKTRAGDKKAAASIIRKSWSIQPHPDLAAAFAAIEPDETPVERKLRFERMIGKGSAHPEARMLMAELSIAAENFPEARREIADLPVERPTVRSLAIMAAIERGEGAGDAVVRGWLAKAVSAPRGPQWVCDNCSRSYTEWSPICAGCDGFDTLEWTEPPETAEFASSSAGLLTLVAGASGNGSGEGDDKEGKAAANDGQA